MNDIKIISPCISICKNDPKNGFCFGCARTDEEKKIWKNPDTTSIWKEENLDIKEVSQFHSIEIRLKI
mgnify:CR=1 FL=1